MKKFNKKILYWLIPVIVVVVAAAVAAILILGGGSDRQTQTDTELYWNVDASEFQGDVVRPRNENGNYFVTFASRGETVRLEVTEEVYLNGIDMYEVVSLVFDENGLVVDYKTVEEATGGFYVSKFYVEAIDGNTITCNSSAIFMGYQKTMTINEDTQIYMVAGNSILTGRPTQLQYNDEVTAVQDHQGNITHVFTKPLETYDNIYWNVTRKYNSNVKATTRELDVTGGYVFEFIHNGELITAKARDLEMANQIDAVAGRLLMLEIDEEGYVTECLEAGRNCGGYFGSWYRVSSVSEDVIGVTRVRTESNFLVSYSRLKSQDFVAYDVSGQNGVPIGTPTQLRPGDEITGLVNDRGQVFYVIVLQRMEESKMYWNVERQWDSTKANTTRTPDSQGWYHILLAVDGEQKTFKTQDAALVKSIDSRADRHFGLKLDGDVITAYYAPNCVYGGSTFGSWYDVMGISEYGDVTVERLLSGSNKGKTYTAKMASDCKVYDTTTLAKFVGEETTLQVGDRICAELRYDGKIQVIYVVNRMTDSPIYWNVERKWDSSKKASSRTPAEDGYYYIKLAVNGKQFTYKTKSKSTVNQIDGKADMHFGLITSGDLILRYLPMGQVTGGGVFGSWYDVTGIDGNQVEATRLISGSNYGKVVTGTMIENCPVYDVTAASEMVGRRTTLHRGDRICGVTNARGEIVTIFVVGNRYATGTKLYWNVERKWDSTNSVSTRKPDEEGYYSFLLACDGQQVTMKTKDADIVRSIDAKADKYFNLKVDDNGIITRYYAPSAVYGGSVFGSWYDVTDITDGVVTVERTIGGSNQGRVDKAPMADNCAVYNTVTAMVDSHIGEKTQLKVGDRICGHKDKNGKLVVIYVVERKDISDNPDHFHCACVSGYAAGVGNHTCDATTGWSAWDNPNRLPNNGNWYLTVDVDLSEKTAASSITTDAQVRLCLNGHTVTGPENAPIWYVQNYLAITDCTGSGRIITQSTANGSMAHIFCKAESHDGIAGEMELFAGTISSTKTVSGTGYIFVGNNQSFDIPAIFNMYGGTITGGNATSDGGAIRVLTENAVFNMYGGTITDCHSAKSGGAIFVDKNATFRMAGGIISNCSAASNGGALYVSGTAEILGGAVLTKNTSVGNEGGNVNIGASGAMYMHGGKVTDGTADKKGGNFQVHGILKISGGTISGGTAPICGGNISTYSNSTVTISGGTVSDGGLYLDKARDAVLCTLNISGGTISAPITLAHCRATVTGGTVSGGMAVNGASEIILKDKPVIANCAGGNLKLSDGSKVTVSALSQGANIWVSLSDLTDTFGTPADATHASYFHSDITGYEVALNQDGALYLKSNLPDHIHCVCGGSVEAHGCTDVKWLPLSGATTDFGSLESGYYYLIEDIQISSVSNIKGKNLSICLNGHKITTTTDRVFGNILQTGTTLNIADCSGKRTGGTWSWSGSVTGGDGNYGTVLWADDGATVNIYGGNILGSGHQAYKAGLLYISGRDLQGGYTGGSVLNIYNGVISGGKAGEGGNIWANIKSKVNIYGGTITGGEATAFSWGTASNQKAEGFGGNILVESSVQLRIYGGVIENGTALHGGNLYIKSSNAALDGAAVKNGTASGYGGNFYITGTVTINDSDVTGGIATNTTKSMGRGGSIYNTGTLTITDSAISGGKAWHGGNIAHVGGTLTLTNVTVTGGHADLNLDGKGNGTGGNLFCSGGTTTVTGGKITNGVAFNGGNLGMQAKATVSGTTISGGQATKTGGNIFFYSNGNLTLKSNTTVSDGSATNGGNVGMAHSSAVLTCENMCFTGGSANTASGSGGSMYVSSGSATLTNVTVTGGNAKSGGALAVGGSGTCKVIGSTVESPTGGNGRAAYIAKGGKLTVQDSTMNNTVEASNGTCIWNCGTLILVGTVNLNKDVYVSAGGVDIMVDARSASGAVMDITGLTAVNEPIIVRRWETDSNDYAGLLANGATEAHVAMFKAWNKNFAIKLDGGKLYLSQ